MDPHIVAQLKSRITGDAVVPASPEYDALGRWASDEFRSLNAQIEVLLRQALTEAGRMPKHAAPLPRRGRPLAAERKPAGEEEEEED